MIARALILWLAILPLAVANGVLRERLLRPFLGVAQARTLSGLLLMALIFGFAVATIGWLPRTSEAGYLAVGGAWLAWTIAFEFGFGRLVARSSWRDLIGAYRFRDGNIWPLVLAVVALSPWLAALVRSLPVP